MDPQFDDVFPDPIQDTGAPDPFDFAFSAMPILMGLFELLFVAVVVSMVVVGSRKARRYREAGIDPLTADVERDIRMMQALESRCKITSAERDAARATLLGTL